MSDCQIEDPNDLDYWRRKASRLTGERNDAQFELAERTKLLESIEPLKLCWEAQTQLAAARTEIASLQHDLSRHLSITSEQATEILGKEKALAKIAALNCEHQIYRHECCPACIARTALQLKGK